MKITDKVFRKEEETTTAPSPAIAGMLDALENFGGGPGATTELKEDLGIKDPPKVAGEKETTQTTTETNNTPAEDINANLGKEEVKETTTETSVEKSIENITEKKPSETTTQETSTEETTQPVQIKSEMFEGGVLDLGVESKTEKKKYPEEITKFIDSEYGFKSPEELKAKLSEYTDSASTIQELTDKLKGNDEIFKRLPTELANSMSAFFNGEKDWKSHVTNDGIDFAREAGSFQDKELVEAFFPGQFTSDDWEEFNDKEGDVNTKRAIEIVKQTALDKFQAKQNQINTYQSGIVENQTKTAELVNNSIGQTISNLPSQMKGLKESYVKSIESKIRNGEILNLYYNQDGTLKPDAAHRFILAQDGSNLIEQYANLHKVQAKNEATQEILDRTANTPDTTKGGSSTATADTRTEVQKRIDGMEERFIRKPIF